MRTSVVAEDWWALGGACLSNCTVVCVVQVETATDSEPESKGLREYHSVGIQVEDEKRYVQWVTWV